MYLQSRLGLRPGLSAPCLLTMLSVGWVPLACSSSAIDPAPLPGPRRTGPDLHAIPQARSVDLDAPLEAEALASIAVFTNPDLQALRASEAVAEAQVFAAGLYPDPSFSLGFDTPLNGAGLTTALASSLGVDFAGLVRRPSALRGARADLESVRLDIAWAEWLTGERVRLVVARIAALASARGYTSELRRLAEEQLSLSFGAVSRGDLPASELESRRLAATDAGDRDRSVESEVAAARLELNRLLGVDPSEQVRLATTPLPKAELSSRLPDVETLFARAVSARADLAAQRAAYSGSRAAVDAARLDRFPLPSLSVNLQKDTGGVRTLGPAVSFTLPLWNRGRGEIAVARASRDRLRAEYASRLESVRADIAAARSALLIAEVQYREVAGAIQPLVPAVEAAERAAARGDIAALAAASSRMALLDKQVVAAGLAQAVAELRVALEISTGSPLELAQ